MEKQYPVLVYGTLRPYCGNYERFLEGYTTKEVTVKLDGFTMWGNQGFPYLTRGDRTITATLVTIDEDRYAEVLLSLDWLEGYHGENTYSNHYDRVLHTFTHEGKEYSAWIYVASKGFERFVKENYPILESGDWFQHQLDNQYLHI